MSINTDVFEHERRRLTALAYRMLGRWSEAEDTVQDSFLRWQAADRDAIESAPAWLTTVVVRLCLDRIRKQKASREIYVGPWLPEPILTPEGGERRDEEMDALASDLSIGLLHVLERLGPEERAAFILREAFDASYAEIASTLGKSETAIRQLVSRARERVRSTRPRFETQAESHQRLLAQFMSAVASNSQEQLLALFQPDIQFISDGGGKAPAALRVVNSPEDVARLIIHLSATKGGPTGLKLAMMNGLPSVWFRDGQGYDSVVQLEIVNERISAIFIIRNPDKLAHLSLHLKGAPAEANAPIASPIRGSELNSGIRHGDGDDDPVGSRHARSRCQQHHQ